MAWKSRVLVALVLAAPLFASQGRDFAGTFHWKNPIDHGNEVSVRLTLDIRNFGTEVVAASIEFQGQADDRERREFIAPVSLQRGESVKLNGLLMLSKREFQLWRQGRTPRLVIRYTDHQGATREQVLDLTRPLSGGGDR